MADYFPNTKFPTRVDHRGHYGKTKPLGIEINAHCAADESGTGIAYTTFSLADTQKPQAADRHRLRLAHRAARIVRPWRIV